MENLDLEMVCYECMETDFETGYIEFVDQSVTIAKIHKDYMKLLGPFYKKSIMGYFEHKISKDSSLGFTSSDEKQLSNKLE